MLWIRRRGPVEGANGVELDQQGRARASLDASIVGTPVANTRQGRGVTTVAADLRSPQNFAHHPRVRNMPGGDEPVNEFVPHLPGRVPPAGWDGEPGATSPTAGWV
jgi:hypothetical protein